MSYWVIKRGDEYVCEAPGTTPRLDLALRYASKAAAKNYALKGERVVRVVTRPRRSGLPDRLAAWEPVVRAACDTKDYGWCGNACGDIDRAVRDLPKEHWPKTAIRYSDLDAG